jgi:hypothetical protein
MAFTNPILSGEELNRTGIKSENYVPGTSGWRVASNGAAEFDNVGIRGNLWAPSITLNGRDLWTMLEAQPKGIRAWMGGYPTTSTTSGAVMISTEVEVVNGRWYEISLINITPDIANTKACEFHIKYTTDGSAANTGSPTMAISLRLSQFEMGNVRAFFGANFTGKLKLAGTIHSLDGANVRCWAPGTGCILAVYDVGLTPTAFGSIGVSPPAKTLKEWQINTQLAARYKGNGQLYPGALPSTSMSQGDFSDGNGNYRSWAVFGSSEYALLSDLVGVPFSDILTCELYMHYDSWWLGQGVAAIGYHNSTTLGSVEAGGGLPGKVVEYYTGTGGKWIDLLAYGNASGSIVESMRSGYFKGIMTGNYGGTAKQYTGWAMHTSGVRPAIHAKYYK